ncbi:MAG: beta-propeller domain-containing protein, partial [Sphingopyxis sp.]|nr:beta-propeller domain-containing protein [Sphingopyxis sp.]
MRRISGIGAASVALAAAAWAATPGFAQTTAVSPPPTPQPIVLEALEPWQDPALDAVTAGTLETFENDAAFRRYLARLSRIRSERREEWALRTPPARPLALFQDAAQDDPCSDPEACPPEEGADAIIVTGARTVQASQSSPVAITNVQTANVDEGDVVKQIGNFLLVLQDGRVFSVDMRGGMRLADRINVYRDADDGDAWYDEMLVEGNRILITAYNYRQDATEISVFKLDTETGRISRDGSFLISSEDYYDSDNYATRIVGDNLIIYTPYEANEFVRRTQRPRIRRWMSQAELDAM